MPASDPSLLRASRRRIGTRSIVVCSTDCTCCRAVHRVDRSWAGDAGSLAWTTSVGIVRPRWTCASRAARTALGAIVAAPAQPRAFTASQTLRGSETPSFTLLRCRRASGAIMALRAINAFILGLEVVRRAPRTGRTWN
eukprot:1605057-Prymnesium_polylepis.1